MRQTQQQLLITTKIAVSDEKNILSFSTATRIYIPAIYVAAVISTLISVGFGLCCAKEEVHEKEIPLVRDD